MAAPNFYQKISKSYEHTNTKIAKKKGLRGLDLHDLNANFAKANPLRNARPSTPELKTPNLRLIPQNFLMKLH